jgi:Caspase domain/N-acetylmuramoyl-L-alanine amidase
MLGFVSEISNEQLSALLKRQWVRQISSVHIHHTWRPRASQWRGKTTIEAIRRVHTEDNKWSDIAQHLTIAPDGTFWSGRHLDHSPASAVGHNGSASDGPFMIEIVGDFDIGQDRFEGTQADATYQAVAAICQAFEIPIKNIRFHREFNRLKTCPGSSLDLAAFRHDVEAEYKKLLKITNTGATIRSDYLQSAVRPLDVTRAVIVENGELDYDASAQTSWVKNTQTRGVFGPEFSSKEIKFFNNHVVNTSSGRLSKDGYYSNSIDTIEALVDNISNYIGQTSKPRIMLYAHGGLVSEELALSEGVLEYGKWWLANGVYPIYFVWETGLRETFKQTQQEDGSRGAGDWLIEKTIGKWIGRQAWDRMKLNAQACSRPTLDGPQEPGGAFAFCSLFAQMLAKQKKDVQLHAVGHSAGSIFHCEMLPMLDTLLRDNKAIKPKAPSIKTLAFLAPACRVDLFSAKAKPMIVNKQIEEFALFTMNALAELDDNVAKIYSKSLLHLVRNACEHDLPQILGLEESIRQDGQLVNFFNPNIAPGNAQLILGPTIIGTGGNATQSTSHGGFDNDPATMNSVLRRILELSDKTDLPEAMLPKAPSSPIVQSIGEERGPSSGLRTTSGTIHALCIGIDNYPIQPLSGCVADAKLWAETFTSLGIKVHELLLNEDATKRNIVDAWKRVSANARAGDTLVIQYAGHGTQVPDLNNDETDMKDEAWVPIDGMRGEVLIDDEIGGLIDVFTPDGVQVVIFSDSCHSGSTSRAKNNDGITSRFVKLIDNPAFIRDFSAAAQKWEREIKPRNNEVLLGLEILYSGCQDHQSSYEQNGHGKFTLAAVAAIKQSSHNDSYRLLADKIVANFGVDTLQQPNFTASKSRATQPLFGRQARAENASNSHEHRLERIEAQLAEIKSLLTELR